MERMIVRPRLAMAAAVLLVLAAPALAQDEERIDPRSVEQMPHDQALRTLGEALSGSVQATQSDPSIPDILKALDDNIAATRRIRQLAESADVLTEDQMRSIGEEVAGIARSFREIADMAPGVFARRWQEVSTIEAVGEEVGFRIADARASIERLKQDNARIQRDLRDNQLSQAEIEKHRLTQQANEAETHSLEAAIQAWGFFADRHGEIMQKLGDQSEDLDVFFHALRENARVYEAAAQTLNLANSLKLALSDLESVQSLDAMRGELVDSWGDLMKIVDEVNNGLILTPAM